MVEFKEFTLYPSVSAPMMITTQKNKDLLRNNDEVVVTKAGSDYGVVAKVMQYYDMGSVGVKVELKGLEPVQIINRNGDECEFVDIQRTLTLSQTSESDLNNIIISAASSVTTSQHEMEAVRSTFSAFTADEKLYYSAQLMRLTDSERESVLKEANLNNVLTILKGKVQGLEVDKEIEEKLQVALREDLEKSQKEYILRQKKEAIEKELGESEEDDAKEFEEKLEKLVAPDDIKLKIKREIKRFKKVPNQSGEKGPLENYIRTMLDLPWGMYSTDDNSLTRAEEILDEHHYGMEDVKERILEYLAVKSLTKNDDGKGTVLCLAGPPGVGKTSIATSLAESLGRTFEKVSLGGVNDESAIRGHRRTYVGSMPGKIMSAIKKAGTSNPVILLDEIDKMASEGNKGDPASAMLEVLDPSQNHKFNDHYLDCEYDLSQVVFIATANYLNQIPPALRDRLEIINLAGYTINEKMHIAKEHLVTRAKNDNGVSDLDLQISDAVLLEIIKGYTKEAGVRNLQRALNTICRKLAVRAVKDGVTLSHHDLTLADVKAYLGTRKFSDEEIEEENQVGVVNGMYYSAAGGGLLGIDAIVMPGKGNIKVTGNLKDVMKESSQVALSYIRSVASDYGIEPKFFDEHDIHLHAGDLSTPKDGPSASLAIMTAILSAITGKKVNRYFAITGESNLRGKAMIIGGVKEKILGAKLGGCTNIIIPEDNKKDLEEISEEILEGLNIHSVKHVKEVFDLMLV